jgi:hypothetical protein
VISGSIMVNAPSYVIGNTPFGSFGFTTISYGTEGGNAVLVSQVIELVAQSPIILHVFPPTFTVPFFGAIARVV